jgi:cell division FtsZ-interacting protein ZapD
LNTLSSLVVVAVDLMVAVVVLADIEQQQELISYWLPITQSQSDQLDPVAAQLADRLANLEQSATIQSSAQSLQQAADSVADLVQ